jgi:quercetin dioxygenase-like cupin family protein
MRLAPAAKQRNEAPPVKEASSEVQLQNETFRVTKWTVKPGETIPMHVHEHEYVVIPMRPTPMQVTTGAGEEFTSEMNVGHSYTRAKGSEHQIYNADDSETVEFIEVESLQ